MLRQPLGAGQRDVRSCEETTVAIMNGIAKQAENRKTGPDFANFGAMPPRHARSVSGGKLIIRKNRKGDLHVHSI